MAKIIGRLTSVGIGKETTKGTAVAPSTWVPVQSIDIDDVPELLDNDSGVGSIFEFNGSDVNTIHGEGGYEGKVFDNALGLELYATLGQAPVSTQRGSTGVYDHVFSLKNDNNHGSLTLAYKDNVEDVRYAMAMVDELTIDAALDNYLTRSLKFMSQPSASASNTVTYSMGNEFLAKHLAVYIDDYGEDLDNATAAKAMSFSLSIKKNLKVDYVFGSATPDDIYNQTFNVEGSVDLTREDTALRADTLAGNKKAIRFEAINTGVEIGTGTDNPAFRADLPNVAIKENPRNWEANEAITQTINFQGNLDMATAAGLTFTLTNTATSY